MLWVVIGILLGEDKNPVLEDGSEATARIGGRGFYEALVVQWIGHLPPKEKIEVRFFSRAPA